MSNKFLSFNEIKVENNNSSGSVINVESNKIYKETVGDVSIIDLPSADDYDLLHYYKDIVTETDISFRYKGVEIVKAFKQHIQNLQLYNINSTWIL